MGNCFASCFENKESLAESTSNGNGLSTDIKSDKLETATVNNLMKKVVAPKLWNKRRNRVAPTCDDDSTASSTKTLQGSTHFLYPMSGLSENLSSVKSTSNGSSSRSSHCRLESSVSSYDEFSSQSSYSEASDSEESRSPNPIKVQPSRTQGRLIIVQPCRSLSPESYESSSENLCRRVYPITCACTASESSLFGSFSDNMEQLDDCSEEECAQVHPYIPTKCK